MDQRSEEDFSITTTFFYLKFVGFWLVTNKFEERMKTLSIIYTVTMLSIAVGIEGTDLYYSLDNFGEAIYTGNNVMTISMVLLKIFISYIHRKKLLRLVIYAKTNFWHLNYEPEEMEIMDNCRRTCTFLICAFSFLTQGTVAGFIMSCVVENIGRNESDRVFPFNVWLDVPEITLTPYFEIISAIEVLALCHVGVCYLCFDNFLCLMNLHAACQFRILQHRLSKVYVIHEKEKDHLTVKYYDTLRGYFKQHQTLIAYCDKFEEAFSVMVLAQVLLFSLLICLDGFLVLMDDAPNMRRVIFAFHLMCCICQLLMFTYSCDCLIRESLDVATAVYNSPWTVVPHDNMGKMVRKDLVLMILRSRVPCCITASGFFVVSLETYTRVLSTAVSYFTLLNQY
nr:PREDICTED: odorant receptor 13a-like [Megachile rotundata]